MIDKCFLIECRAIISAYNDAEHMLDGFGGRKSRPSDALIARIDTMLSEHDSAAQVGRQEAVGLLSIRRFRRSNAMVNHDFELYESLPDGDYLLYTAPATQPASLDDARDAERYRWLREFDAGAIYHVVSCCDGIHPEILDAAIDAAIMSAEG